MGDNQPVKIKAFLFSSFEIAGFAKKCLIPYKPTFGENFKRGKVVDVNPSIKVVTLESGEKLAYDDLIIATGTGGPFPAKLPLDVNKEKAVQRYDDYVKLVSDLSFFECTVKIPTALQWKK